ncbi:prepilin peptidase [Candidatus Saccharibacteria bacterium]|nr:prepilin peptidase [Candidatus Saccharibacteria bacterium]
MYRILLIVFSVILGSAFGSFACCQAWRIRLKEKGKKDPGKRSVCLKCGKKLTWYENIPIISWLLQGGKCRKCGEKIGKAEIIAEVFGAVGFGLITWNFVAGIDGNLGIIEFIGALDLGGLVAVLAAMVGMIILMVYDGKWGEMPVGILIYTIVMGLVFAVVEAVGKSYEWIPCPEGAQCISAGSYGFSFGLLLQNCLPVLGSVALLAGTYYLLYFFSKEKLVGGGDWMLCLAIGLILGKWELALAELFLSNFLGAIAMLPQRKKKMAFGPFLVIAFVIVLVFSEPLIKALAMNF